MIIHLLCLLQLALTQSLAALRQALNQLVPGLREKIQTSVKPILAMPGFWEHLANQSLSKAGLRKCGRLQMGNNQGMMMMMIDDER